MRNLGPFLLLALQLCCMTLGCAKPQPAPSSTPLSLAPDALVRAGRHAGASGQHLAAEEYFVLALERGANRRIVVPLLLETCLSSKRYRSALFHVEAELQRDPSDASLLALSTALRSAVGLETLAPFSGPDTRGADARGADANSADGGTP